jgi:hypothetical protein
MTARGSRSPAMALAWAVSDRNGRVMDRDTSHVRTNAAIRATTPRAANRRSRMRASATRWSAVRFTAAAISSRISLLPPQSAVVSGSISSVVGTISPVMARSTRWVKPSLNSVG